MDNSVLARDSLEKNFAAIDIALETLISHYRILLMDYDDDPLAESVNMLCLELIALRKKISNKALSLSDRIDCVDNISKFVDDFTADVVAYKKEDEVDTLANELIHAFDRLESSLTFNIYHIAPSQVENTVIGDKDAGSNENFFRQKSAEIKSLVAQNPDLKTA